MNKGMPDNTEDSGTNRFYYGTRAKLKPGHLIEPGKSPNVGEQDSSYVYLTSDLDPAIWEAEVADGEGPGRVYIVEPIGQVEDDLIGPGYTSNYGRRKKANYVYFSGTLNAATWGAELAAGEGPGRIYLVESTGPVEDDPNLTNKKFRGNPTKSFRSRDPLRVTGEITDWQGHSPEALQAMKEHLKRLEQLGVEAID